MPMPFAGTERSEATAKKLCQPMLLFKRDHNVHLSNVFKELNNYEYVILGVGMNMSFNNINMINSGEN